METSVKKRILVMDDEEVLREFTSRLLSKLGYDVEVATEGEKAIELFKKAKESGQPFDAVIMDLTIHGGLGGKETISKLREIDPEIKAILSSGYSNDPLIADYKKFGFKAMVTKPYTLDKLSRVLSDVIEKL